MIVSSTRSARVDRIERNATAGQNEPSGPAAASTALVPVTPVQATSRPANRLARPDPAFVTHLIAMAQQAPQTRTLRRASPEEAQAHYRAQPATTAARGILTSKMI